jgi:anti-sigma-K factor RskA
MTGPHFEHPDLRELSAGYVLDALDPADEQRFLRHAADCPRCRGLVTGFREVTEALAAEAAPLAEPSSGLADRILAATRPHNEQADGTGQVVPLHGRAHRWRRPAAVAAAAAIIAGGVWGGLAATAPGPQPVLAACAESHTCARVGLTATASGRTAATVIVHDGVAWMQPSAMAANPAGEIYVLWQITGARIPLAVGSFDIHPGARGPVRIGSLAVPYSGTWAFAVSLEHGRTIPARPSKPVALGQVS